MTPECHNALKSALDELKKAIAQSVGADSETFDVIKQIESTISSIERKLNWVPVSTEAVIAPATV
jgi:hypothetical protein